MVTESQREFAGSEWEQGYCMGSAGRGWVESVAAIRRELGRHLAAAERASFAKGWRDGAADRADQVRGEDESVRGEIALAMPL